MRPLLYMRKKSPLGSMVSNIATGAVATSGSKESRGLGGPPQLTETFNLVTDDNTQLVTSGFSATAPQVLVSSDNQVMTSNDDQIIVSNDAITSDVKEFVTSPMRI